MWQSERRIADLKLSPGLINLIGMATLIGLIGLAVVTLVTTSLIQNAEPPSNPLATFVDVFPGQPRSGVDTWGFSCYGNPFTNAVKETCTLELVSGALTQVQVAILDDVIDSTTFVIREDALRLGDFEAFFGTPEMNRFGSVLKFLWPDRDVTALALHSDEKWDHFLPLWSVSFTRTGVRQ